MKCKGCRKKEAVASRKFCEDCYAKIWLEKDLKKKMKEEA